jgi:hypothetical protein
VQIPDICAQDKNQIKTIDLGIGFDRVRFWSTKSEGRAILVLVYAR